MLSYTTICKTQICVHMQGKGTIPSTNKLQGKKKENGSEIYN